MSTSTSREELGVGIGAGKNLALALPFHTDIDTVSTQLGHTQRDGRATGAAPQLEVLIENHLLASLSPPPLSLAHLLPLSKRKSMKPNVKWAAIGFSLNEKTCAFICQMRRRRRAAVAAVNGLNFDTATATATAATNCGNWWHFHLPLGPVKRLHNLPRSGRTRLM